MWLPGLGMCVVRRELLCREGGTSCNLATQVLSSVDDIGWHEVELACIRFRVALTA